MARWGSTPRGCSANGYRDAKLRTILDTAPDVMGTDGSRAPALRWTGPEGATRDSVAVILVSNSVYRLGRAMGSGSRPRIDDGLLGIAVMEAPGAGGGNGRRRLWRQWSAPSFEVGSTGPVPAGVDGGALTLEPPLRFTVHPGRCGCGSPRTTLAPHRRGRCPMGRGTASARRFEIAMGAPDPEP